MDNRNFVCHTEGVREYTREGEGEVMCGVCGTTIEEVAILPNPT